MADRYHPVVRANSGGTERMTKADQQNMKFIADVMERCVYLEGRVHELEKVERRVRAIESYLVSSKALPVVYADGVRRRR